MGQKIVIGPIDKGLRTDREAFNIDNDSFPVLLNAYQWRGRVKRKRGTLLLTRLQRNLSTITLTQTGSGTLTIIPDLLADTAINLRIIQPNAQIVPKSLVITFGTAIYTDTLGTGILTVTGVNGVNGTINYTTGQIALATSINFGGISLIVSFSYYPVLPVMGLEDLTLQSTQFPGTIGFDTTYAYNIPTTQPSVSYDVSYYKNPIVDAALPNYVPKTVLTPTTWNGKNYQQFWSTNYEGALWVTNGIQIPFSISNIGMQFNAITGASIVGPGTPPAVITLNIANHGLVVGDFVFINEIVGMTGINFQTGYVISTVVNVSVNVEFPDATISGVYASGGIAQYLTNRSDTTVDSLRWYDGDPTNGTSLPVASAGLGWVNFSPPLSEFVYSIAGTPQRQWYLVGARMIVPFKDRLLFLGPVIQTSSPGSQVYLQDTVIYSQNGTPYYTASFTGSITNATTIFFPILTPTTPNNTQFVASPSAWWEDQTGFGGFTQAGLDQPITTADFSEDAIIIGLSTIQTRFMYTGDDINPFIFYIINSGLGSASTFSSVSLDEGVMSRGTRGFVLTGQTYAKRFDLDIPDQVFEIALTNNGNERFCSQRDFINEWVYFTYNSNLDNTSVTVYPNQTLQYNYRDNSWGVFNESYTTYGNFRATTGFTWLTIPWVWQSWNEPWNSGGSTLLQPEVIGGNQQGFVMLRDQDTSEGISLVIQNIVGSTVTSPDHGLNLGDYILISSALGTIGSIVNGSIYSVFNITKNTFDLNPSIAAGSYLGGGLITRFYVPLIISKQFPLAWDSGRKTRIGVQQYLFTTTPNAQIQLLIFLSQDTASPYNIGKLVPSALVLNSSLVYSTLLYTCPESTNLGLTPANINLQIPTANNQAQTWHRMNTSLIGDTVQFGFTMSDDQMRALDVATGLPLNQIEEIEFHGCILDCSTASLLV